jgi:hypothetical protein
MEKTVPDGIAKKETVSDQATKIKESNFIKILW